jgi:5'-3' exonuclease
MTDIFDTTMKTPTFIFVDGSYYNFYRYYALLQWWKNAHADEPLDDPYQVAEFVEKFKKTHVENMQQIPKKLKLPKDALPILIVGKDCKRENIWRMKHYPNYKGTRDNGNADFKGGPFFKMVYEDNLFLKGGAKAILKHPHLEADDCIALSVKYLLNKYTTKEDKEDKEDKECKCQIYIITSDRDYLQLSGPNVHLFNLTYKNIAGTGNPKTDLEIKTIMGDSSDNIPSIFPKCGPKTAQKCIDNPEFLQKKLDENPEYVKQYELNKLLVNFNNIPQELCNEFYEFIRKP